MAKVGKRPRVLLYVLGGLVLVAVAMLIATPIIARKIAREKLSEAAAKRQLSVEVGSVTPWFGRVTLSDLVVRPSSAASRKRLQILAPEVIARLSGLTPYYVEIRRADVALDGNVDEVLQVLESLQKADAKVAANERLPIDVTAGAFHWKGLLGEGSELYFSRLSLSSRPETGLMHVEVDNGKLAGAQFSVEPMSIKVDRARETAPIRVKVVVGDDELGRADVTMMHGPDGDDATAVFDAFQVRALGIKGIVLDLKKTIATGEAHLSRDADGEARTNGNLKLDKVAVPPMKVGPIEVTFGADARITWKGAPKKGKPGTMVLSDTHVDVIIRGKTRVLTLGGEVSLGPEGRGPFLYDVRFDLEPVACAEIAGSVGGLAGNVVAVAVTGTIRVGGTAKGALDDPGNAKIRPEIHQSCALDLPAKGLLGIPTLPLTLP